ncbi:hypothetical protein E2C01_083924 [Portunus trituberculatus]|uniref:Uncharacterized protein n=1 Tax=Portunus trituberculatus TaxID=210409 RepID=A0A5B7J4X8_PORTR|nr:hypothetical protein [Portunus trituberculatus]
MIVPTHTLFFFPSVVFIFICPYLSLPVITTQRVADHQPPVNAAARWEEVEVAGGDVEAAGYKWRRRQGKWKHQRESQPLISTRHSHSTSHRALTQGRTLTRTRTHTRTRLRSHSTHPLRRAVTERGRLAGLRSATQPYQTPPTPTRVPPTTSTRPHPCPPTQAPQTLTFP